MALIKDKGDWTFEELDVAEQEIGRVGRELGYDPYPTQYEIITANQMLDLYSSVGLPTGYHHWSYGKDYVKNRQDYVSGKQGLAFEIVVNTNPSIAYLMETNTLMTQVLVMAHACVSGRTEYLSPSGWRRMDQYDGGLVAQYRADGTVEFVHPEKYIEREQHEFLRIEGRGVSQEVTADHRVIYLDQGVLKEKKAAEFEKSYKPRYRFINSYFLNGPGIDLTDDEIALHVVIKEVCVLDSTNSADAVRYRAHHRLKHTKVHHVLSRLKIPYEVILEIDGSYKTRFVLDNYISACYDRTWYGASNAQLCHIRSQISLYGDINNYRTEYKSNAYFVQHVLASTGVGSVVTFSIESGYLVKNKRKYGVSCKDINIRRIGSEKPWAYCFSVPSGMFVTRLDGDIAVTGNCQGHGTFFRNNYMFRQWTEADAILGYMKYAKDYIKSCEAKHGIERVEKILDACHALSRHGVDRYKHPRRLSLDEEVRRTEERREYAQSQVNILYDSLIRKYNPDNKEKVFPAEPEENLLYFVEKYSPKLETWEREIVRITRKIAQYFWPQRATQVSNEGYASHTHYTIMNRLYDDDVIDDGIMLEFLKSHSSVLTQLPYSHKYYSGINPYALGFAIYTDIERICNNPTDEDREWFPYLAGKNAREEVDFAMRNFKDQDFILQYLSPKVIRDMALFNMRDDRNKPFWHVTDIQNEDGYRHVRRHLSEQYDVSKSDPDIQVTRVEMDGDRTLHLTYKPYRGRALAEDADQVLSYLAILWGFDIRMDTVNDHGELISTKRRTV